MKKAYTVLTAFLILHCSVSLAGENTSPSVPKPFEAYEKAGAPNPIEQQVLDHGRIGDGQYIAGGILGTFLGFGIGHAVSGVYSHNGLIFTLGELLATGIMIGSSMNTSSVTSCSSYYNCTTTFTVPAGVTLGALAFVGLHIWEIVDIWAYPPSHNARYDAASARRRTTSQRDGGLFTAPLVSSQQAGILVGLRF